MSKRVVVAFPGPDADPTLHRRNPDLAVADLAGTGHPNDGIDDSLRELVVDHDVDSGLGHEVNRVLGSTVDLGVAALPAVALDFGDGQPEHARGLNGVPDVIDGEGLDDRRDQLHGVFTASI